MTKDKRIFGKDLNPFADLEDRLKDVEWELNTRPRKRLDFQTPLEVFTQHLEGGCGRF